MPEGHSTPPEPVGGHEGTPELPHTIKQHALTGATVHYHCRQCQAALHSKLAEAGEHESCPNCGTGFIVPGVQAKIEEARRAVQSEKATREAERMKEAAKRVERQQRASRRPSGSSSSQAGTRPQSSEVQTRMESFNVYKVTGRILVVVGLALLFLAFILDTAPSGTHNIGLLNSRTNITIAGSVCLAGGLVTMAAAAVGGVLCYCAERLHAIERIAQRQSADHPPSPRGPQS